MTLIERAARASCSTRDPDDTTGGPHPTGVWLVEGEAWWTGYVDQVRHILAAIREPSEEMVKAGQKAAVVALHRDGGYRMEDTWQAMIDAALAEGGDMKQLKPQADQKVSAEAIAACRHDCWIEVSHLGSDEAEYLCTRCGAEAVEPKRSQPC